MDPVGKGGFDRRASNVLSGKYRDRDMVAFDYTYKTRSADGNGGTGTQTHRYVVCALALPTWLPYLEVGPENVLEKLGNALGFRDIELESEEFNRRFRVNANDPKFAYDVLPARTLQHLLALPAHHWRIEGNSIVCWGSGRLEPVDLLARLNTLAIVVDGIPDFVWRDNGIAPTPQGGMP